jgi:hypothetical protein
MQGFNKKMATIGQPENTVKAVCTSKEAHLRDTEQSKQHMTMTIMKEDSQLLITIIT